MIGIGADERGCHIHAEAISTQVQPEFHYLLKFLSDIDAGGISGRKLPTFLWIEPSKTVVQGRLKWKEVGQVTIRTIILARKWLGTRNILARWCPDIPVRVAVPPVASRSLKPL